MKLSLYVMVSKECTENNFLFYGANIPMASQNGYLQYRVDFEVPDNFQIVEGKAILVEEQKIG